MKNIRILEDGNRLIVVLEGYERSAVDALISVLGTAATPLSHIKPHTGEAQFQFKGTEKEVQPKKQETPIKPPAFMEKMMAGGAAKEPAKTAPKETPKAAPKEEPKGQAKPAAQEAQQAGPAKETPQQETPAAPKAQQAGAAMPEARQAEPTGTKGTALQEEGPAKSQAEPASRMDLRKLMVYTQQADRMGLPELKAYIQRADQAKLTAILYRKREFPNMAQLLNADTRTIREYVKELMLPI